MLSKAILTTLVVFMASKGLTIPTPDDAARMHQSETPAEWEVQASPSGPLLNLTGTVEAVYAELKVLNPNYDNEAWGDDDTDNLEDMPTFENDVDDHAPVETMPTFPDDVGTTAVTGSDTETVTDTTTTLTNRQNPTDRVRCNNLHPKGYDNPLGKGADHLRKIRGRPHLRAGPSVCAKVSCSWDTAIWWCNDNRHPFTLPSYRNIGDGATVIRNKCMDKADRHISGEINHIDKWSVKVLGDDC
ncbi:hypothetical protein BJX70DRAFT_194890 [Aspergillus crustosus]